MKIFFPYIGLSPEGPQRQPFEHGLYKPLGEADATKGAHPAALGLVGHGKKATAEGPAPDK